MGLHDWGATAAEVAAAMVGDDLIADPHTIATRSIDLESPPHEVFPWIRQMGFGRAGWYSYDWIDNLGRPSARDIRPELQQIVAGDRIPGAPRSMADFTAAVVDEPHAFVLAVPSTGRVGRRIGFTLAYELHPVSTGTRLVTRMRARLDLPGGRILARRLLGPGDGIMVRRQLLNLADRTRTSA